MLSTEDKKRIEAEEAYRAQIASRKRPSAASTGFWLEMGRVKFKLVALLILVALTLAMCAGRAVLVGASDSERPMTDREAFIADLDADIAELKERFGDDFDPEMLSGKPYNFLDEGVENLLPPPPPQ